MTDKISYKCLTYKIMLNEGRTIQTNKTKDVICVCLYCHTYVNPFFPVYLSKKFLKYITFRHNSCLLQKESLNSDDQPGLTFKDDSGEEVALWRLTSLSCLSKTKFKSACNFEEMPYVARIFLLNVISDIVDMVFIEIYRVH